MYSGGGCPGVFNATELYIKKWENNLDYIYLPQLNK